MSALFDCLKPTTLAAIIKDLRETAAEEGELDSDVAGIQQRATAYLFEQVGRLNAEDLISESP